MLGHLLPLFFAVAAVAPAAADTRPNLLVILTDDQGWADIGYNNPERVYTPHLDRLAASGVKFTRWHVMPQCTPTRVAAMTGRYPGRFGREALQASNLPAFPHGTPTLASLLAGAGYETHLSGKWHLGSTPEHGPNHFGFQGSYGSLAGAVGMYDHRYREGPFRLTWRRDHKTIPGHENGVHATDLVAQDAVGFIRRPRERPFFLYLAFHAPHTPLDERGDFVDTPTQIDPERPGRWLNEGRIRWFNDPAGKIQSEPDPEKRLLLAAVHHVDDAIGRVVEALEQTGQLDNTLLLFSSDNGPQINWPGGAYPDDLHLTDINQPLPMRGAKTDVWQGGVRVPGFAHWPARLKPREEATPLHIVDWLPTLTAVARAEAPKDLDGVDLSTLLIDRKPLPPRDLYWTWGRKLNRRALTDGRWKIVHHGRYDPEEAADWQLFNLVEDPKEQTDLAERRPDRLEALHRRYLQQRSRDAVPLQEKPPGDKATK